MFAKEKVISTFYYLNTNRLYYNEIKEFSKLSHSSLQNALKKLVENNIVEEEKTKSNKFYKIKNKKIVSLRFSEISADRFNKLDISIKNPLRNFLKEIPQEVFSIILFGSASVNEQRAESDIDLLIVTHKKINFKKNKEDAELLSKYPISLFQCNISQFLKNEDDVIIQAKKNGFPIYKEQNFYEVKLDEYR